MRFSVPLAFVAPWFLFMACGSNSTAGAGGSGTGTSASTLATGNSSAAGIGGAGTASVAAYCNATAEPFCEAYFACCSNPVDLNAKGGTVENCKKLYSYGGDKCIFGNAEGYAESVEAGRTLFDQPSLDACVAHLKAMAAGGADCVEPPDAYLRAICSMRVFQGQLALGETCVGLPLPIISQEDTSECKHGYCEKQTRTCQPLAQVGDACANGEVFGCEIGEYLICGGLPDAGSTCLYRGELGEPCVVNTECRSYNCDGTSGTCGLPDAYAVCGHQ